jgi:hypothetical protein
MKVTLVQTSRAAAPSPRFRFEKLEERVVPAQLIIPVGTMKIMIGVGNVVSIGGTANVYHTVTVQF